MKQVFLLKAAALLHEPVDKPWVETGVLSAPLSPQGIKPHEEEALRVAGEILKDTVLAEAAGMLTDPRIRKARLLSLSAERLLAELAGGAPAKSLKLKNLFNPAFEVKVEASPDSVSRVTSELAASLNELLRKASSERDAYHLLYAFYEALWVGLGGPSNPVDLRAPTATVFDEVYATASTLNWLLHGEEPSGLLLMIDIPSIQVFIPRSRKLRDLWVSSYLVSALAWRTAWTFIEKLGPDVLVMPTCRYNPFYYHSLLSSIGSRQLAESVEDVIEKVSGYNPERDTYPLYAVVPGTLLLVLPDYEVLQQYVDSTIKDRESLEKYAVERYREAWSSIWSSILGLKGRGGDAMGKLLGKLAEQLEGVEKVGFDRVPPLPIRVITVEVSEILEELGPQHLQKLYHCLFAKLQYKLGREKLFRVSYASELDLTSWTSGDVGWPKEFRSGRGFDYCTSCGELPAVLIVPREQGREEFLRVLERELGVTRDEARSLALSLEPYFSGGEKLCPYCLAKRIMALEPEIMLKSLLGAPAQPRRFEVSFPSTSDVASVEFRQALLEKALESGEAREKVVKTLMDSLFQLGRPVAPQGTAFWRKQQVLLGKLRERAGKGKELEQSLALLELLVTMCAELLWFSEENRKKWLSLARDLRLGGTTVYYALVRADCDNVGKLISGKLEEALGVKLEEHILSALEGEARSKVESALCGEEPRLGASAEIKELVDEMKREGGLLVSPLYHASLSGALMRTAVRDIEIVEELDGFAVYSGGDDLLALAPVSRALAIASETRLSFGVGSKSKGTKHLGFEKLGSYHVPSLILAGRSYAVYEAHYRYPMSAVLRRSHEVLEQQAKEAKWSTPKGTIEKDTLVAVYAPGGGERTACVLLRESKSISKAGDVCGALELAESVLKALDSGVFSESLVYDALDPASAALLERLLGYQQLLAPYFRTLLRRNLKAARKAGEDLADRLAASLASYNAFLLEAGEGAGRARPLVLEIIKLVRLARSGVRGFV
ncbi:MAG: type III-B CRISPR-associated protein Cas10/Cmr2 [Thermofilum sp.]